MQHESKELSWIMSELLERVNSFANPGMVKPVAASDSALEIGKIAERRNWLIHLLYIRQEYTDCLNLIEEQLKESRGICEYALYVKGLIKRGNGELQESLVLFQAAASIHNSVANFKQVGRSLYLMGQFRAAEKIYKKAQDSLTGDEDWELCYQLGLCYVQLKMYDDAIKMFEKSNVIMRRDQTYIQIGKVYTLRDMLQEAIETYNEALTESNENTELLTTLGLLYLRVHDSDRAMDFLGSSMTLDNRNPRTILATGSIIQDHGDFDVALSKYRIAAVLTPNNPQLWNNIGMCFFGQKNFVAAISCLRRALQLAPFEYIIAYNLGLTFLYTEQFASAFHYLSCAINLNQGYAASYAYLAVALHRLDNFESACAAYEKAISMEADHVFYLNYAITLFNNDEFEAANEHFAEFKKLYKNVDEATKKLEPEVMEGAKKFAAVLAKHLGQAPGTAAL